MTEAEKILEASQVALERAGVVAESAMKAAMEDWLEALPKPAVKEFFGVRKKFPNPKDKKTVDAKNLEILKKYKIKPLIGDPSHRESLGALSCCLDMLVGGQGESVETKEEVEITESTVKFMLDKKVVLRRKNMKDGEAKAAATVWKKYGILPFRFDKTAAEKYRMPWKSKLVDGGVTWGPDYKKGQTRDAVVEQVETAERQGDSLTEGKGDYYAVEGTVDGQAGGAQTAPTTQEAMGYAEAMLAYLKKQSPKAKKITVHIFKVVNYQRKDTPMKVLKAESRETQGDTLAEGKAVKIGRLTFESFTNGSISGWWVKHIPVVQGQGVWKPNTLGWIEERKSTKTSVIPSFLWLEKGNGEENTKALIVWPKGSAPVAGANIVVASNPGTGGLLQAVAKWIQERRPDLVKEETLEPKLTESQKIIEASQVALGRAGVVAETSAARRFGQTVGAFRYGKQTPKDRLHDLKTDRKWRDSWEKTKKDPAFRAQQADAIAYSKLEYEADLKRLTKEVQEWYKVLGGSQEGYESDMKRLTKELKMKWGQKPYAYAWGIKESAEQVTEEKQAPKITEKMIRDDMGLGSQDIGKGAMQILRSGWCANCDKEWYAVVFLAKNRTWWAEISGLDRHATYTNMGKRSLHNAALAKFDAPGKWKDTTGQKYTPVTN